jgi:hypothetical protein
MKSLLYVFATVIFISCSNNNAPDVSAIKVSLTTHRFEKAFFAIDSNNIPASLGQLQRQFPGFTNDFTVNILGAGAINDSNQVLLQATKAFYQSYLPVYETLEKKYADITDLEKEILRSLKYVKYYFPKYPVPGHLVTFIGPFDAPGIALTQNALAVGLQLFAGKSSSFYNSEQAQQLYPAYISRRFDKEYIVPGCMKAIAEDLYPDQSGAKSLIDQMIAKGRYWYLLDKFLPGTPDSLKSGFKQQQLEWCNNNEGLLWSFFLQNNQLFTTDPSFIQLYIGEAPDTQGFGEASPGNIGQWVGWQIVRTYMTKHPETSPQQLMEMETRKIFNESKYKPK